MTKWRWFLVGALVVAAGVYARIVLLPERDPIPTHVEVTGERVDRPARNRQTPRNVPSLSRLFEVDVRRIMRHDSNN